MTETPARPGARPLVLAHRGASADAPENTMAAFRLALQQGADGFELDVWRCRSGEVVVVHDPDTSRTTGVRFSVTRTPWKQLQRLDAGALRGEEFAGQRIPRLDEVLDAYPMAVVNVELKSEGAGDPLLAFEVARIVRAGVLLAADQNWRARSAFGRALGAAVHPERSLVTAERAAGWRRGGRGLHVWTVDEPAEVEALCALGVDSVISNRPGVAREAVRRATGA